MGESRDDAAETSSRPGRSADAGDDHGRRGGLTRRQFAAGAGATLLLPVAVRLSPWTRDAASPEAPGGRGAAARTGTSQEAEDEPPGTEALTRYVEARWGDRLSEDDLEEIRSGIAGNLRAASAVDEVPLDNGDGPAPVFRPYRA